MRILCHGLTWQAARHQAAVHSLPAPSGTGGKNPEKK